MMSGYYHMDQFQYTQMVSKSPTNIHLSNNYRERLTGNLKNERNEVIEHVFLKGKNPKMGL